MRQRLSVAQRRRGLVLLTTTSTNMAASVHQTPLLWIPLKQTEEVDVATPVRSLISSSYGEDPKRYSSALGALARARTDALRGSPGSDRTARDLLYKWFHILEMLEVRFPELRVPFTWKDVSQAPCRAREWISPMLIDPSFAGLHHETDQPILTSL